MPRTARTGFLVDLFAVNFGAGFINNAYIETLVAGIGIAAKPACQLFAVLNDSRHGGEWQAAAMPQRNAVLDVKKISSHEQIPPNPIPE